MRVFLTGGTGLIGSHVAEALTARGHAVRALVRPGSDAAFLRALGAEIVEGDIGAPTRRLARQIASADAVVHAAALVFRRASEATYERINVASARNVFLAAEAGGAPRVVHISSVAVYGRPDGMGPITEDLWTVATLPRHARYARSKRAAEAAGWALHEAGRIRMTALRPVIVYGERDRLVTPVLARLSRWPLIPLPGGGHSPLPITYADNVADAVVAALERPVAVGRAYNIMEPRRVTTRALLEHFALGLGRRARFATLPGAPLLAGAAVGDVFARLVPGLAAADLRRGVRLLLEGVPYDTRSAAQDLDWTGRVEHEEAIRRAAAWWRAARG